ncbi:MAG: hypothetical protein VKK97_03180 [Synechococcaceae cyanobacterium]|nr:hypothetical protein [Synechococcaceae cyanobacterium]
MAAAAAVVPAAIAARRFQEPVRTGARVTVAGVRAGVLQVWLGGM